MKDIKLSIFSKIKSIFKNETKTIIIGGNDDRNPNPHSLFAQMFQEMFSETEYPVSDSDFALNKTSDFYDMIARDPHVHKCWSQRVNILSGSRYTVVAADKENADKAKNVLEIINRIPNWYSVINYIMESVFRGVSFQEIIWKKKGVRREIEKIIHLDKSRFFFMTGQPGTWYYRGTYQSMSPDEAHQISGIPFKYIVSTYKGDLDHPHGRPLSASIYWHWKFKRTATMMWLKLIELYSNPWKVIKCESDQLKTTMKSAMANIQNAPDIYTVPGVEVDIRETGGTGNDIFKQFVSDYCNPEISKAILGQAQIEEVGSTGFASIEALILSGKMDFLLADRNYVESIINQQIVEPILALNYPFQDLDIKFVFDFEEKENLNDRYTRDIELSKLIDIPKDYFYTTYAYPRPGKDDEIVKPPAEGGGFSKESTVKFAKKLPDDKKAIDKLRDKTAALTSGRVIDTLVLKNNSPKQILERLKKQKKSLIAQVGKIFLANSAMGSMLGQSSAVQDVSVAMKKTKSQKQFAEITGDAPEDPEAVQIIVNGINGADEISGTEYDVISAEALNYWTEQPGGFDLYEYYSDRGLEDSSSVVDDLIETVKKTIKEGKPNETAIETIKMRGITQAKTAHRTNLQRAYQEGRKREIDQYPEIFPAFIWRNAGDARTRGKTDPNSKATKNNGSHWIMEGVVFLVDDPYMKRGNTPPADYNCRCRIEPVPAYDMNEPYIKKGIAMRKSSEIVNNIKKFPFWK